MAIALNLTAPLLLTKAFAAGMVKNKVYCIGTHQQVDHWHNFLSVGALWLQYTGTTPALAC